METLLALEMVRVTEAAAIASARYMGRGDRHGGRPRRDRGDAQDVRRGRDARHDRHRRGRARRGADALHRRAGRAAAMPGPARDRHRRRSARGHEPRRAWAWPTRSPCSPRPRRAACSTRPTRTSRSCASGRSPPATSTSAARRPRTCSRIADALGRKVGRLDGRHPRSAAPRRSSIDEVRAAGARIKLISDGDLSAAISCAVMGTGVHAVMGIGGAPEGVLTAAALRCLGGEIQARFRFRNDEERARAERMGIDADEERVYTTTDLAPGENLVFCGDRRDRGRPAQRRPLLRRRRADALAGDGLPEQAGALRRHRPHVRPRPPAGRPPLGHRHGSKGSA